MKGIKRGIIFIIIHSLSFSLLQSQVRVRLLAAEKPEFVFITAVNGTLEVLSGTKRLGLVTEGDQMLLAVYRGKVALRFLGKDGILVDSASIRGLSGYEIFRLSNSLPQESSGLYSGRIDCFSDMESLLVINTTETESYVAGVVKAEGGNGKTLEYFKTQAVIARTYTYRNLNRHINDRYNLCDDVHCQSYAGIISDKLIEEAVTLTRDRVIVTPDSTLIISAFHSNCGGETASAESVWLSPLPYLISVKDPYCSGMRNYSWTRNIDVKGWIGALRSAGYDAPEGKASDYIFNQPLRQENYRIGSFSMSLVSIRTALNLRSSWFSVTAMGDSLKLTGRGYGHGVGLCQEGAIAMAGKGLSYMEIINFYYPGVRILTIGEVKK